MARGREIYKKFSFAIKIVCKFYSLFPKKLLEIMLVRNRKKTGYWGLVKRYCILKNIAAELGDNVSIHPDVYIFNARSLKIGSNVSIHPMCYIEAYGGIEIGSDVSIAHSATLMSVNHTFSDLSVPIKDQEPEKRPITIKSDCWIGAKATILGNTVLGTGSIVGAGAVVTKSVDDYCVVAGIPAKVINKRK